MSATWVAVEAASTNPRIRCLRDRSGRRPRPDVLARFWFSRTDEFGSPEPMNSGRVEVVLVTFEQSVGRVDGRAPEPYSRQHRQAGQNDARGPSYRAALGSTSKPKAASASSMSAWEIGSSE